MSAALAEEPLFRGLMLLAVTQLPLFRRRPRLALLPLLGSSAVFGALHLPYSVDNAVVAGVAGLLYGGLALRWQSLWPAVVAHGLFDSAWTISVLLTGSTRSGSPAAVPAGAFGPQGAQNKHAKQTMRPVSATGPSAGRSLAGRGSRAQRPGAVEAVPSTGTEAEEPPPAAAVGHSSRKRTHREARRRRSVLVRFDEAEYAAIAAVRIGVACNKLAAKALPGGVVSAAELAAAAAAAARSVARVEAAAALVHRRLV